MSKDSVQKISVHIMYGYFFFALFLYFNSYDKVIKYESLNNTHDKDFVLNFVFFNASL